MAQGLRAVLTEAAFVVSNIASGAEVNHQIQLLVAESWFSTWASSQGTVKAMGNGLASPLQMPNPLLAGQNSGIATMMQVAQGMPSYVMEEDLELTVISEMPGEIKVPKTLEKECYPKDLKEKMEKEKTRSTSPDQKTLQEQVEQLETGLAKCVADFRAQAEEVLMQHLDSLEEIQQSHDFEVANLMAENMLLREKLGLKSTEHVQSMMFQNIVPEPKKKAGRGNRAHAFRDDEDDKDAKKNAIPDPSALPPPAGHGGAGGGRGTVRKGGKNQPQGSWQAFMAWVPLSSSMQQAEPWKPLPQGEIAASGQSQKSSRQVMKRREPSGEPTAILPGTPDERPHKKGEDDDSDSDSGSAQAGEEQFELLELWRASQKQAKKMKRGSQAETESSMPFREEEDEYEEPVAHGWILNPDSNARISWDLGSLVMVLYDMVMIPMQAYTLPENIFLDFMEWTTRLFWTLDILWSCFTGVVMADGSVEYDIKIILKRYAKTWLTMDLIIVLSDWSEVVFSSGGVAMLSFARTTRIVRIVRLLRLVRMQEIMANVTERIQSETLGPLLQVSKVLIILLTISHFTGCLWFAIGARETTEDTWVKSLGYNNDTVDSQYLASLHWAIAQFSGGMDEISPASPLERLFAVAVQTTIFVIALVMLGVFTSGLTQQYIIGGSGARQLATLKRYLKQNNVSKATTKRVCRNAKHAISGDLTPESVELLHVISEPLKVELSFDMYSQVLMWHPFFLELLQENSPLMRPICHRAMSMLLLSSTDIIFNLGEDGRSLSLTGR
ncbi:Potassium voltage-gated channel subfamily H member 5 (Ether-a-go-go potassium channel 2) (rEAG2) (Voltage-gated potassium channel subunit Kv10.2) [Durusdinium trenchii]|uniref:Potassium voltage-gated channel subfamily H member 5 (Ether-a-go-go potassium channel 2) (REAG2) (Voltage-gated potassium channel subunit Kv10.2) n=1 Tax=Durusdinium trenchii TaxID=1381693 RepID=A0ABP0R7A0_9DINO